MENLLQLRVLDYDSGMKKLITRHKVLLLIALGRTEEARSVLEEQLKRIRSADKQSFNFWICIKEKDYDGVEKTYERMKTQSPTGEDSAIMTALLIKQGKKDIAKRRIKALHEGRSITERTEQNARVNVLCKMMKIKVPRMPRGEDHLKECRRFIRILKMLDLM